MIKKVAYQSDEYIQLLDLRNRILRIPLGMDIQDDPLHEEVNDLHFGYFEGDQIIGTLILRDIGNQTFKMRQVAVSDHAQGKGIGQKMVHFSEKYAQEKNFKQIELNARDVAIPFYEKLGYQKIGNPFEEVSIIHYKMIKTL
ncbi:cystathionine beta-lyase [Flavobacteriaceae bacterium UJ101]|nr:cystathionine beta-lyase [Flavobacteriaceae bacterium UJ101]